MPKINRFEDLKSWQKARILSDKIFKKSISGSFEKDFGLKDQILRASGSIMDNIAEGFGRESKKEFINFLVCARGSCDEVKSQLYRVLDRKYVAEEEFTELYDMTDHIHKMITKFIFYLKDSNFEGLRD